MTIKSMKNIKNEAVRHGLRQLEDREARLAALRAALADGENSGASTSFDMDAFLKAKHQETVGKAVAK